MSSLFFLLLLLSTTPALSRSRHVIHLSSPNLRPSSLAWDPTLQHFLLGSSHLPLVSTVSDAGLVQTLISTPSSPSISAVSVDNHRRRLLVAAGAAISAFDLRSPHPLLFSSPIPANSSSSSVSGVAVDPATGTAFFTASDQIFSVDLGGKVSLLAQVSGADLGGLAHVSRGFLLVIDRSRGQILKVDDEDGTVRRVMSSSSSSAMEMEGAEVVAVRSDGAAVVAGGGKARWLTSKDGWSECAVFDEYRVEDGERVLGVVVRERKSFYLLVSGKGEEEGRSGRIEEVEWEREGEGEMVWMLVLVGFGMAYFMYWRLQMGKLVTNVNKKRE